MLWYWTDECYTAFSRRIVRSLLLLLFVRKIHERFNKETCIFSYSWWSRSTSHILSKELQNFNPAKLLLQSKMHLFSPVPEEELFYSHVFAPGAIFYQYSNGRVQAVFIQTGSRKLPAVVSGHCNTSHSEQFNKAIHLEHLQSNQQWHLPENGYKALIYFYCSLVLESKKRNEW